MGSGLGSLLKTSSAAKKKSSASSASGSGVQVKSRSIVSSIFDSIDKKKVKEKEEPEKAPPEQKADVDQDKMKITRVFDFAGENVRYAHELGS